MRGECSASASAGRSLRGRIAGAKSRVAGYTRQKYNSLRARNHRRVSTLQNLSGSQEEEVVIHSWMKSDLDSKLLKNAKRPAYVHVKEVIERKLAQQKSGMPTDEEVREMAATMNDTSEGEAIDAEVMEREIRRFAERMEKYNTKEVGSMTLEREEGRVCLMFIQLNNVSTKAIRL